MTIFDVWQLRVTLDSIRNSCNVYILLESVLYLKEITTGFYVAKLQEIGYQVCFSSWRDVYETIQNPEFRNPAIGGV